MRWFKEKKKIVFLLDQDNENTYKLNDLDRAKNIGIIYTGEWDIELKKNHEQKFKNCEKIYPHENIILYENTINKSFNWKSVENVLQNGPLPITIRDLSKTSIDFLRPYHMRRYSSHIDYNDWLCKLAALHLWLDSIKALLPERLVLPEKIGWIRKYISYYFYSKGVEIISYINLKHNDKYCFEVLKNKKIRYVNGNFSNFFDLDEKNNFEVDLELLSYRENENRQNNRLIRWLLIKTVIAKLKFLIIGLFFQIRIIYKRFIKNNFPHEYSKGWKNSGMAFKGFYFDLKIFFRITISSIKFFIGQRFRSKLITSDDYILIPLHYFPEASTIGEYTFCQNEVQYFEEIVRKFSRVKKIYVIDHPTSFLKGEVASWIGQFYNDHFGVEYLPYYNMSGLPFDIIKNAEAVVTILGGVALEKSKLNGIAYIMAIHPMLHVNNINIIENCGLERYNFIKMFDKKISIQSYCKQVNENGLDVDELLPAILKLS